ncbi:MAG TPA: hypothetical protein VHG90_11220, partial [Acidimicrobiales bacterium]|nr:hypothetical protein [Acidimicrobiales bacterium]
LIRWPERHVVVGIAAFSLGASDRYLGQLATLLGRFDDAEAHFAAAHRLHERLGAPGWLAHGRVDHARMLITRGRADDSERARTLLAAACHAYRALGMAAHELRAQALVEPAPEVRRQAPVRATFRPEGGDWLVEYGGDHARLRHSKGLVYLAVLLSAPRHDWAALDLVEAEGQPAPLGPRVGNPGREPRAMGDAERARLNVIRAIERAIRRVSAAHPALGEHLRATIRTGVRSSYTPDDRAPIEWNCGPERAARRPD